MMEDILHNLNRRIDHAALHSAATEHDVFTLCHEARKYDFFSVAVNPAWVRSAFSRLRGTDTLVTGVVGFPLGASLTDTKVDEAVRSVEDGAFEVDMVTNIGWLTDNRFLAAEAEIVRVRKELPDEVVLKVIIEAGMLTKAQQRDATKVVMGSGAQFVKTSTGFFGGATVEQVRVLRETAHGIIEVKASGGIKTLDDCRNLLEAGATRLGSSSSVQIMEELQKATASER